MEYSSQKNQPERLASGHAGGESATQPVATFSATPRINLKAALPDIEINVLTRQSSALLTELINRLLMPAQLNCVCYLAMMYLHGSADNRANPSEISLAIGDTRTNMTRICDELAMKGLMHRVSNSQDRRRIDLSLTAQGIALLQEIVPLVRTRVQDVMSEFNAEEKALLVGLMARLNHSLEAQL